VAAVLWRQPLGRLRARLVWDVTVLTGLDALTRPLLHRMAQARGRASIVVIEPDGSHPCWRRPAPPERESLITDPASPRVLLPVLAAAADARCAISTRRGKTPPRTRSS
jgi:hypothetical protein